MSQDTFAFKWTAITFSICVGLVLLTLLVEHILDGSKSEGERYEKVKITSDVSTDVKINVSNKFPNKHGLLRKISQKYQQICLNHPSAFALGMVALTLVKLFVQIFDVITDGLVAGSFWEKNMQIFVILVVLIAGPFFAKWISLSEHINEKCIQGTVPQFVLWVNFFLPAGIWFPFFADIYIVSRILKGQLKAYRTGRTFHLEDDLFSLQRIFALREVQMESLPQALFQLGLLFLTNDTAPPTLILLSVGISSISLVLQVLQLRSLSQKESFNSIFDLIQNLARGTYIAGVNQIRNSSSSILNLCSIYMDSAKMKVVLELIKQRPNLKTIILNAQILQYPPSYIADWLFELNTLELKFFYADGPQDIDEAFQNLDIDGDEKISIDELAQVCDDHISEFWIWKYGENYKMTKEAIYTFIQNEAIHIPKTCCSIFELAFEDRFCGRIQTSAKAILKLFGEKVGIGDLLQMLSTNQYHVRERYSGGGRLGRYEFRQLLRKLTIDFCESGWRVSEINTFELRRMGFMVDDIVQSVDGIKVNDNCIKCRQKIEASNLKKIKMKSNYIHIDLSKSNGDLTVLNGCNLPLRIESSVVDVHSLQCLSIPHLTELYLQKSNINRLSNILHGNLPSLKILDLNNCTGILQSDITSFKGVSALEMLDLSESNWSSIKLLFEGELPSLKKLNLGWCTFLDCTDVDRIQMSSLEFLNLQWSNWSSIKLLFEGELPSLKSLHLNQCESLDFTDVDRIQHSSLETLNLSRSNWSSIKLLFEGELPSLKKLDLRRCESLDCTDVDRIQMSSLETLDLSESNWSSIKLLFEGELPSLKNLKLNECKSLDFTDVDRIQHSSLETLILSRSNWSSIKLLFEGELPSLKTLIMNGCESLDCTDVDRIQQSSLETLDLERSNWSSLKLLYEAELPSLKTLDLRACKSLDRVDENRINLPSLEKLFVNT